MSPNFLLSLCKVAVDVVEDVGCVRVEISAREGLRWVHWRVARVVELVVGVFVFARSAWPVHAVADCDPDGVRGGAGRCRAEQPLGFMPLVPGYGGVGVDVLESRNKPCVVLLWQVGCGVGVVACLEVQYGPWCCGCAGVTGGTCVGPLLGVLGDCCQVLGHDVVFSYAPLYPVVDDSCLCRFDFIWSQCRVSWGPLHVTRGTGSCFQPVGV